MAGTLIVTTLSGGGAPIEAPDGINIDGAPVLTQGAPGSPTVLRNLQVLGPSSTFQVAPTTVGSLDNVNIGSNTPAAAAFSTLVTVGPVIIGDSPSDPVTFNSSNINIPNNLSFDSNTFFIDSANNRIGVNNATPTVSLDVTGSGRFTGNLTYTGSLTGGSAVLDIGGGQIYKDVLGNVGIGTNSPAYKLDVFNNAVSQISVSRTGGQRAVLGTDTSTGAYVGTIDNSPFKIVTNSTEKLTVSQTGCVALGLEPSAWIAGHTVLQFQSGFLGTAGVTTNLRLGQNESPANVYKNTGAASRYEQADGNHLWFVAPTGTAGSTITAYTRALTLNNLGNLGLGSSPDFWNQSGVAIQFGPAASGFLYNDSNNVNLGANAYFNSGWRYQQSGVAAASRYLQSGGVHAWYSAPAGNAGDPIPFTQTLVLNPDGNLGLGTATPNTVGYGGTVLGVFNSANGGNLWLTSSTTTPGNRLGRVGFGTEGNTVQANKQTSAIVGLVEGVSAGNVGGALQFLTKADGGALVNRLHIDNLGNIGLSGIPTAASNVPSINSQFGFWSGNDQVNLVANAYSVNGSYFYTGSGFVARYGLNRLTGDHVWNTSATGVASSPVTLIGSMILKQNGNLLLGSTVDTGYKLTISGTGALGSIGLVQNTSGGNAGFTFDTNNGNSSSLLHDRATNALVILKTGTEVGRFTSASYLKVSNTGAYGGEAGLGDRSTDPNHIFQSNADNTTLATINANLGSGVRNLSSALATGAAGLHYDALVNAATVYRVLANGDVQNTNNSYGGISDETLKENIVDAPSYLTKFMQVRFRNFNFKASTGYDTHTQFGVIAQELEEIFPSLVTETPNFVSVQKTRVIEVPAVLNELGVEITPATTIDEDYTELEEVGPAVKGVKLSVLTSIYGKVIQEQQTILETHGELIQAQQDQITTLSETLTDVLTRLSALELL